MPTLWPELPAVVFLSSELDRSNAEGMEDQEQKAGSSTGISTDITYETLRLPAPLRPGGLSSANEVVQTRMLLLYAAAFRMGCTVFSVSGFLLLPDDAPPIAASQPRNRDRKPTQPNPEIMLRK